MKNENLDSNYVELTSQDEENQNNAAMHSQEEEGMDSDILLTEVERQEKYLSKLPESFEFPLFNSQRALESQRKSGYRDTASAAREIVDNAWEAGAKRIDIVFDHSRSEKGKDLVTSLAFIDNGSGMIPRMIQYALSLGGGTHFEEPKSIGKFGFGLPNASINQTRRVEVYSRVKVTDPIMCGILDIDEYKLHGLQSIREPVESHLPIFVQKYLEKNNLDFEHGTVVVWVSPDRLTYKTGARLKEHLIDDFGITYRYLLESLDLIVERKKVEVTDPLFLNPEARFYLYPDENGAPDAGGAIETFNRSFVVKHFYDPDTEVSHVERINDFSEVDRNDPNLLTFGRIEVRVSRLPYGFAANVGNDADSKKRLNVRQNARGISFVRAGREIETLKTLPHTERDKAAGLGDWLTLQSYDYHWGAEVKFNPELDEIFGITNDKQKVRPMEDFWRVISSDDINLDSVLRKEHRWQTKIRKQKMEEREQAKVDENVQETDEPSAAETAAAGVEIVTGKTSKIPSRNRADVKSRTEKWIADRLNIGAETEAEVLKALEDEKKRRPFKIGYFEDKRAAFYEPEWGPLGQILVNINRKHPFFEALYGTLFKIVGGRKAKDATDLLLIALSKAELEMEREETQEIYRVQREEVWSPFLEKAVKLMSQSIANEMDEVELDEDN